MDTLLRDGGVTWDQVVASRIHPIYGDGEVGGIASVSDWAQRGRGVEGQEVGAFREGKHWLGVWVSVCVCLNLSVCVCALEPPPQKSRDASSGGGCPVCPFPLLLAVPSQEPLPWATLQAGPGSTRNSRMGQPSRQPQRELGIVVCVWSHHLWTLGRNQVP